MIEWVLLVVALALVAANALFVAAEFSLVTVDRSTVERAAQDGDNGADGVLTALRSLSTQLSGAQLGITVTSLVVGFLAEPSLATLLGPVLTAAGLPEATALAVAIGLALVLATFVQMVFGELVPKNLAIARPLPVAKAVAGPQRAFSRAVGPLLSFLNGTANRIVRLFGIEPQEELRSARSPQELGSLVRRSAQEGVLAGPTADLVTRSLAFGDRTAADVMTPRFQVTFLATTDTADSVLDAVERTGHSRFPVLRGGVDSVVGIVHVKHALAVPEPERGGRTVADLMVPPLPVPGSQELDPLLPLLRAQGLQMAVVVDEYGGTAGVVTLEDLIEEIVGDIADEHDARGDRAVPADDGGWTLSGLLRPDEVAELSGIRLPEGDDFDSLGGLVVDRLGRVPRAGDTVTEEIDGHRVQLRVERMDGWRVDRVGMSVDGTEQVDG
ncbi:hemolysin family protein [Pseudonocardia abyssalis]|uniref:HlyC/CorC family transporter n=1 Tax=Pseudonocardia abyssalis TaxID=2792008 RepID=A0ABS6ULJ8_9PSEU|nr:hemolysin family protein [Pseudonocardia abyssalis]MBW0117493.1 HlyC/CorC family transporter [Pseudonocardia abyssalis]MBW0133132.1 HlyC/CorC family transporter [Pseudonocardia abyssalis]